MSRNLRGEIWGWSFAATHSALLVFIAQADNKSTNIKNYFHINQVKLDMMIAVPYYNKNIIRLSVKYYTCKSYDVFE